MAGFAALPSQPSTSAAEWSIPITERSKYDHIFDGLQPVNGLLTGDKVKPVLLNSNLPVDVLGHVWDLSDIDGDGMLDREEFSVAMHLVYRALEKNPVPPVLPVDMIPLSKRVRGSSLPGAVPVLPAVPPILPVAGLPSALTNISGPALPVLPGPVLPSVAVPGFTTTAVPIVPGMPTGRNSPVSAKWVVTAAEKAQYDEMFVRADGDMDGFVNGAEIKDIFLQSGLPQLVLAHIWTLCDSRTAGKLNSEQFALAMYLVQQTLKGIEPPAQLSPDMIPPSMRAFPFQDGGNVAPMVSFDTAGMKELDLLSKDIDDLKREKMKLEQEKTQKEADIKIRNGEVVSLQKELDALSNNVKQLEMQKAEAQKRLDELDDKKLKLENSLKECKEKYMEEQSLIKELQYQIANRESLATNQEAEMKRMRDELNELRQQEIDMEEKVRSSQHQADQLDRRLSDIQEQISQVKMNTQKLRETQKTLSQSVGQFSSPLNNNAAEDHLDAPFNIGTTTGSQAASFSTKVAENFEDFHHDPFVSKDPFPSTHVEDPFHSEDPFSAASDPFAHAAVKDPFASSADPFAADPFTDAFSHKSNDSPSFAVTLPPKKMAGATDPWGGLSTLSSTAPSGLDNFDPFHVASGNDGQSAVTDPFGTGSFVLSPSDPPQLPPKQRKAPAPPRPPAPRPAGPGHADPFAGDDPFDGNGRNATAATSSLAVKSDPFASFADFSPSKFATEAEQLAWATRDSSHEWQRLKKLQEQEQADLEMALALSQQDT